MSYLMVTIRPTQGLFGDHFAPLPQGESVICVFFDLVHCLRSYSSIAKYAVVPHGTDRVRTLKTIRSESLFN